MKTTTPLAAWIEKRNAMMAPVRELDELAKRALIQLSEQQFTATKEYVAFATHSMQSLSAMRDSRALLNEQLTLTKRLGSKMLGSAQAFTKLVNRTGSGFAEWVEKTTGEMAGKAGTFLGRAA